MVLHRGNVSAWVVLTVLMILPPSAIQAQISGLPTTPVPGTPTVPGAAGVPGATGVPGAAGVTGAAGAAQPSLLGSAFGGVHGHLAKLKRMFCNSPFGSLVGNGMEPLSMFSGGLLSFQCCPPPTAAELAQQAAVPGAPPTDAQQLASAIQADQAQVAARVAAVEYLATVDCRYWPQTAGVLRDRLRADKSECVRFAAAKALGTGCCCNKVTIEALKIVVTGSDEDGNPPEASERVRAAAFYALMHCLTAYGVPTPEPGEAPAVPEALEPPAERASFSMRSSATGLLDGEYYEVVERSKPIALVIEEARRVLATPAYHPMAGHTLPPGHRSVYDAFVKATDSSMESSTAVVAAPRNQEPRPAINPGPTVKPVSIVPQPTPQSIRPIASPSREPTPRANRPVPRPRPRPARPVTTRSTGDRSLLGLILQARNESADSR